MLGALLIVKASFRASCIFIEWHFRALNSKQTLLLAVLNYRLKRKLVAIMSLTYT